FNHPLPRPSQCPAAIWIIQFPPKQRNRRAGKAGPRQGEVGVSSAPGPGRPWAAKRSRLRCEQIALAQGIEWLQLPLILDMPEGPAIAAWRALQGCAKLVDRSACLAMLQ